MGFLHAKCEQCWDSIPCGCDRQKERDASTVVSQRESTDNLLRKQNKLLREIRDSVRSSNAKVEFQEGNGSGGKLQ